MADGWFWLLLVPLLGTVAWVDARTGRIPNACNTAIAALGLFAALEIATSFATERLIDAALVGLVLLLLRAAYRLWRGRVGLVLGEVKFLSAATLWTGLEALPPPGPPLVLAGILASGDMRKALFAGPDTWLPEGATAFGWHVVEVEPRRVTVQRGGEERILDASDALRR